MTSKWLVFLLVTLLCCHVSCTGKQSIEQTPLANTARIRPAEGQPEKVSDDVLWQRLVDNPGQAGINFRADEILVVYSENPQPVSNHETSQSLNGEGTHASQMPNAILRKNTDYEAITQAIADRYGLEIRQQVYIDDLNIASFRVPDGDDAATVLASVRNDFDGQVDWAIHNTLRKAAYTPNDPDFNTGSFGRQWGHWKIGCRGAWDHTMGDPTVWIAVVDTGVRISHEELSGQVLNPATQFPGSNLDIVNGDNTVEDNDGHGTFISGIAVAAGDNNRTIIGVAPGCRVMPVKISNDGWASSADIIAGCLLAHNLGAKVINLSFGDDSQVPAEEAMVNQIWSGGGIFVGSAGNEGVFNASYPAAYANSICVGATDYWDEASVFSNWGSALDIAAPGQELKSCGIASNSSYEYDGMGTSYSAPMVAAGAALLWSFEPSLSNTEVRDTLMTHSGAAWNFSTLLPRLDVSKAILSLIVPEIPSVVGVFPPADSVYGSVVAANSMHVSLIGPQNVAEVTYTLDVQPLGQIGPDDPTITISSGGSFPGTLPVPATLPNQYAKLVVEYVSDTGHSGDTTEVPVVIYNQPGDINQDGLVNQQDIDDLLAFIGTSTGSPGWSIFADGTNDGSVNELDLSVIGYNWGVGVVAPEITLVSPLEGTTGDIVSFFVDVTGTEPLSYEWDFGSAAIPSTSTESSPTVELVGVGEYTFSLIVSNSVGSDSTNFQFQLALPPHTTASFWANPTVGQPPLEVDFSAVASYAENGIIIKHEWSWDGDEIWEVTNGVFAGADHTFDTLGEYTVRLQVTDEVEVTDQTTLVIKVVEQPSILNWSETVLGPFGSGANSALRLVSTNIGGKPAAIWVTDASWDSEAYIAMASSTQPESIDDWQIDMLFDGNVKRYTLGLVELAGQAAFIYEQEDRIVFGIHNGTTYSEHFVTDESSGLGHGILGVVAGKPAIFCEKGAAQPGERDFYMFANVAQPTSPADWETNQVNLDNGLQDSSGNRNQLVDINGLPMIQGQIGYLQDIQRVIYYADSAQPSFGDWTSCLMGNSEYSDSRAILINHNGFPLLMLDNHPVDLIYPEFALASTTTPSWSQDWVGHRTFPGAAHWLVAASIVGGKPAYLSRPINTPILDIVLAQSADPTSSADWILYHTPFDTSAFQLVDHGGLPGLFKVKDFSLLTYHYPIP